MDFDSPTSLRAALEGIDAVVHLVGIIAEVRRQTFEGAHVQTTRNLLVAAKRVGIARWVHMSALGARENARSRYHQTKWAAEELVRTSGLAWTILRPSIIYGPGDAFTNLFARMSRFSPVIPLLGGGHNLLQPIGVEMVSRAFSGAISNPNAGGRTFDLCGPERMELKVLIETVLRVCGRRRALLPVPLGVGRPMASVLDFLFARLCGRVPPLTPDQLLMLEEDNVGDGSEADRAFGLRHPNLMDGLARWMRPDR